MLGGSGDGSGGDGGGVGDGGGDGGGWQRWGVFVFSLTIIPDHGHGRNAFFPSVPF